MKRVLLAIVTATSVIAPGRTVTAQQSDHGGAQRNRLTIPEILAQSGGSFVGGGGMPSGIAPKIADLLPTVDIAVRGVVGPPKTYMTQDLIDVFTDYPIVDAVVLFRSSRGHTAETRTAGRGDEALKSR